MSGGKDDDDERTVIGGFGGPPPGQPRGLPRSEGFGGGARPAPAGGLTGIWGPQSEAGGRAAPPPPEAAPPWGAPPAGPAGPAGWAPGGGGAMGPPPGADPVAPGRAPAARPPWEGGAPAGGAMPDPGPAAPGPMWGPQETAAPQPAHAITLPEALRAAALRPRGLSNPLLAEAGGLLVLLGNLRLHRVDLDVSQLLEPTVNALRTYDRALREAGVPAQEAQVALYLMCATADDIVLNLPVAGRERWAQYSMTAQFFQDRNGGVEFFRPLRAALAAPASSTRILELALVCLSLGFEGQYRALPDGRVELQRLRDQIYETLRRIVPGPTEDLTPRWQPVVLSRRRLAGGVPTWVAAAVVAALMLGGYVAVRLALAGQGMAVAQDLRALHPPVALAIQRVDAFVPVELPPVAPPPEETTQIDRIRAALAEDIGAERLSVDLRGDYIRISLRSAGMFASGRAEVARELAPVLGRVAATLAAEPGPIRIEGFTDSIPPGAGNRFRSNAALSEARARAVADTLAPLIGGAARLTVTGRGEADPVASNATPEGRAANRRVEILIQREETL